jgi:hypothetical protein
MAERNLGLGVVEGFFGPEWPWNSRHRFCEFLRARGGDFYLYAPKRDPFLRKQWKEKHPEPVWSELQALGAKCRGLGIRFGVGLSPFELHADWTERAKDRLREKVREIEELGIDYLGLFFDDMRGAPDLAPKQNEIVEFVRMVTKSTLLFCPTYYSHDPILDKVFGPREPTYLERVGDLPEDVHIIWTGSKVIPAAIERKELEEVAQLLKRKPLIWENRYANDGPRQCKFLKLLPFDGRTSVAFDYSSGWAFNLMNQPALSELLFAASVGVLRGEGDPAQVFSRVVQELGGASIWRLFQERAATFHTAGLDQITDAERKEILQGLDGSLYSREIRDWLEGKYLVGPECLTD